MELSTTDASLIAASLTDGSAFAAVFDRHWGAIHRWCVARAGPAGEDLAAETFRVAFDERSRFDPRYPDAGPWLYGIATNLMRRHFRAGARRGGTAAGVEADFTEDALGRVEARALGPELTAALGVVASADRDALLLHAWAESDLHRDRRRDRRARRHRAVPHPSRPHAAARPPGGQAMNELEWLTERRPEVETDRAASASSERRCCATSRSGATRPGGATRRRGAARPRGVRRTCPAARGPVMRGPAGRRQHARGVGPRTSGRAARRASTFSPRRSSRWRS